MSLIESGSSIGTFQACPKKYDYKYNHLLETKGYKSSLGVGSMIHGIAEEHNGGNENAFLDAIRSTNVPDDAIDRFTADKEFASRVGRAWFDYWDSNTSSLASRGLEFLGVEKEWRMEMGPNFLVGKSDGRVKHLGLGKNFVYELKTAADRERDSYIKMLQINAQISNNVLAFINEGNECAGVIYDIIWKPALRKRVNETEAELSRRIATTIETNPENYFDRVLLYVDASRLKSNAMDTGVTLLAMQHIKQLNYYPRNTHNCKQFGSTCEFFDMCSTNSDDMKIMFKKREKRLPELSEEIQK